ncbi:hypothetical protein [Pseudoxanthomonas beigongshangi]
MNRRPTEPLDSEERLLADQLARLGPHGEPSPTLDARILAAAHDAVAARPAVRRKPRWPVAMGLAASALLAVGIAWQLRPVDELPAASETSGPMVARVVLDEPAAADAAAAAQTPTAAPLPPPPAEPAPLESIAAPQSARMPKPETATARRQPATPVKPHSVPVPRQSPAAEAAETHAVESARVAAAPAPPAPPAPAAVRADADSLDSIAAPASAAAYGIVTSDEDRPGFVAAPETTAAIAARREKARAELARDAADAAEAARGVAEARVRSPAPPKATAQPAPLPPGGLTASAPVAPAPASATRNALKRTDLQLPVVEDTKLPPEDWLERIRLRRDLGDRASAADSLVRFRQNHPFQKIPDDLKELLGE